MTPRTASSPIASAPALVGIGLYTLAEAGRLTGVQAGRISRWLRGHSVHGARYEPLWHAQADLGDEGLFLGFRDLQEIRVASAFILKGLSPQRVRQAIVAARDLVGDHPLSSQKFRTDGHNVFLEVVREDGQVELLDLFRKQYAFRHILEQSLSNVDYDGDGAPARWWPLGKGSGVVLDPARSFGQPIEAETAVPAAILAGAVKAEGSHEAAARAWSVPVRAVRRAIAFEHAMALRKAA